MPSVKTIMKKIQASHAVQWTYLAILHIIKLAWGMLFFRHETRTYYALDSHLCYAGDVTKLEERR